MTATLPPAVRAVNNSFALSRSALMLRKALTAAFLEILAAIRVCLCIWNCFLAILRPAFAGILAVLAGLETRCLLDAKAGRPLPLMRWDRKTTSLVRIAEVSRATSSPAIFCSALLCRMLSLDRIARYPAFATSVLYVAAFLTLRSAPRPI